MPRPKRILLAFHWYLEALHQGALRYCLEHGWEAVPLTTDTLPFVRELPADGVIGMLAGDENHPVHRFVRESKLPVVELSLAFPAMTGWGRCPEDCETIALKAADYLKRKAVRSFAFVSNGHWWNHDLRSAAFKKALRGDSRPVKEFSFDGWGGFMLSAGPLGAELLKMPKPVGVFASVDSAAKIAIDAALGAGLLVPEDVVVLGFGNRELESKWTPVPISTIDIDYEQWAWTAASLLGDMLSGKARPGTVAAFPPGEIIERRSTGLAPDREKICERAVALLESSLSNPPAVAVLAKSCGVSKSTLERAFDREFGCGVARKSLLIRIEHAKSLLAGGMKTEAAALACGFRSYRAFISAFRRISGVTPGNYADR